MTGEGRRSLAVAAALAAAVFLAAFAGGFVYGHEPRPDAVVVRVVSDRPPGFEASPREELSGGVLMELTQDHVTVGSMDGTLRFNLPPDTPIEELATARPADFVAGAPVNVGGTATLQGLVLTGVVTISLEGVTPGGTAPESEDAP